MAGAAAVFGFIMYPVTPFSSILSGVVIGLLCVSTVPCANGIIFFFSSRRRHTRSLRDWSSDVCSSDLDQRVEQPGDPGRVLGVPLLGEIGRASCREKSVDLGGRRIVKKKKFIGLCV